MLKDNMKYHMEDEGSIVIKFIDHFNAIGVLLKFKDGTKHVFRMRIPEEDAKKLNDVSHNRI